MGQGSETVGAAGHPSGREAGCSFIREVVAAAFDLPPGEIAAPTRRHPRAAFARQVAMYAAHVQLGMTLTDVGRAFGRDRTTAGHACRTVEDRRDEPRLDAMLDCIGEAVEIYRRITGLGRGA